MIISSSSELKALREGGKILAQLTQKLKEAVEPGKNAASINELAKKLIHKAGAMSAFEGYQGFPGVVCVSLNEEVAHGIPHETKIFHEGDIVSIDFGIIYKEFYTDHAITFALGSEISIQKRALIEVTEGALAVGIQAVRAGVRTGNIGAAIEDFIKKRGNFGIVRKLVGHGIGRKIHEEPKIPNFGFANTGYKLSEGEVIAIEPMLTLGSGEVVLEEDNQTYKTIDGSAAAHFEKTLVVTEDGAEVLT